MAEFKQGDKVVHLGGRAGLASRNRDKVLTIVDGPYRIAGFTGLRYIVDAPVYLYQSNQQVYHANAAHLLKLQYAKELGI
ncbi:MAG: hypothetical protein ING25_10890 [Burkholderiales bacterium]|nr:hypothetical protein [Burkholderiales bacterium]